MSRRALTLALVATAIGCSDASTPIDPGPGPSVPEPTGPAPSVQATVQFGDAPIEGALYLVPGEETVGWTYAIDLDEDGVVDREGILERPLGFDYRFDEPGTHAIRVELGGPEGLETRSVPVIVNRGDAIRIVAETTIESNFERPSFEGMVLTEDGSTLYAGDFSGGQIHGIDTATLQRMAEVDLWRGVEGLSISPSGTYLFPAFKDLGAARLELPGLEPDVLRERYLWDGWYSVALDDRVVLTGGSGTGLTAHDVVAGEPIRRNRDWRGHFDVDGARERAVVIDIDSEPAALRVASLPALVETRSYDLPPGMRPSRVAFGTSGERIYALASGSRDPLPPAWILFVIDAGSGEVERAIALDDAGCFAYCVANPVAASREGKYVAFETSRGVLIVETATGLPLARASSGSVAASPVEDATFWTLRPDGSLRKIVVEP